ncbi:MAG: Lrp/AsnC family transcriptional regulator [Chloroflexota bacterium]|nr:Lrp/AsnC family transcriptional regulator [Chloroflexota bacterium]
MTQVDSLDEQILAALQVNGRLTMKALAEHVGLSSPAMIERVRRLEERGVIAGYRAIIEPGTLGRPLTAVITATVAPAHYEPFLARIHADPAIAECLRVTGEATHLVKVHVEDTAALETLVDELSATGARVVASLVLSSPVPYRAVTPPEGTTAERGRLTRRRRRTPGAAGLVSGNEPSKRPGRPRGRRRAIEASTS